MSARRLSEVLAQGLRVWVKGLGSGVQDYYRHRCRHCHYDDVYCYSEFLWFMIDMLLFVRGVWWGGAFASAQMLRRSKV